MMVQPKSSCTWMVLCIPRLDADDCPIILCRGNYTTTSTPQYNNNSDFGRSTKDSKSNEILESAGKSIGSPVLLCYDDSVSIIPINYDMRSNDDNNSLRRRLEENDKLWKTLSPFLYQEGIPSTYSIQHHGKMFEHHRRTSLHCPLETTKPHRHVWIVDKYHNEVTENLPNEELLLQCSNLSSSPLSLLSVTMTLIESPLGTAATTTNASTQQHQQHQEVSNESQSSSLSSSSSSLDPLLMSCLKRQLAGIAIAYSTNVLTSLVTIYVPYLNESSTNKQKDSRIQKQRQQLQLQHKYVFRVSNVLPRVRNIQSSFYIITPSTRITILTENRMQVGNKTNENEQIEVNAPSETRIGKSYVALSPAANLLIDTIRCVQRGVNVPRSLLLSGPPGCGKTYAVRMAVQQISRKDGPIRLLSLRGSELLSGKDGIPSQASQALARQFRDAASFATTARSQKLLERQRGTGGRNDNYNSANTPVVVVFLDECDALLSVEPIAAMFATILDKVSSPVSSSKVATSSPSGWNRIVVVAATNRVDSIPISLRRAGRLDREIPMTPPKPTERAKILESLLRDLSSTRQDSPVESNINKNKNRDDDSGILCGVRKEELAHVADMCVGYVPADLVALIRRSALYAVQDGLSPSDITSELIERAMKDVGASALRDASLSAPPKITWDDIAGDPGGAKTALRQAIEWPRTKRESFRRLGLIPPRGILLHGPPGCAKTSLARAAAGASGVAFLSLSPAEVYASSYVGEAEAVVRRAFTLARSTAPCILFFDEIDSILGGGGDGSGNDGTGGSHGMGRSGRGSSAEARVLSTFLNEMDGVDGTGDDGVLVLGATNRPWAVDAALLRPGRLGDKIIYVPPPDARARRSIIEMQCLNWRVQGLDLDYLASDDVSGNMTGAEIVGACREAAMDMLREAGSRMSEEVPMMKVDCLVNSLRSVQPLLNNPEVLQEFRIFEQGQTPI